MAIGATTYVEAAGECVTAAGHLHAEGDFVQAHYLAGVAVECLLRAYRARRDPHFESRHDLRRLLKEARFYDFVSSERAPDVAAAMEVLLLRWSNDHRYRSQSELHAWLRRQMTHVSSDVARVLERSSKDAVNAAHMIVTEGVARWKRPN